MSVEQIQIQRVADPARDSRFLDFPYHLYRNEKNWPAPLRLTQRELLDQKKHPFYQHAKAAFFLAKDSKQQVLGRIACFIDQHHQDFHNEKAAFFGFFECEDNPEVAKILFEAAENYARSEKAEIIRGPFNLNSNYESGLMIKGFDQTPSIGMNYHFSYMQHLIEAAGYTKAKDLLSYHVRDTLETPERNQKFYDRIIRKHDLKLRNIDPSRFDKEIELAFQIYNDSWEKNWGFIPLSFEEFKFQAKDFKLLLDPRMVYFVELNGEAIAFSFAVPDINVIMRDNPSGKLLSKAGLRLIWALKRKKRTESINQLRIVALGAKRKYQHLGLGALLYLKYFIDGKIIGYQEAECSWILEDNELMLRPLQRMGGTHEKTHRIFEKSLIH